MTLLFVQSCPENSPDKIEHLYRKKVGAFEKKISRECRKQNIDISNHCMISVPIIMWKDSIIRSKTKGEPFCFENHNQIIESLNLRKLFQWHTYLFREADEHLYFIQNLGRNRFDFWEMDQPSSEQLAMCKEVMKIKPKAVFIVDGLADWWVINSGNIEIWRVTDKLHRFSVSDYFAQYFFPLITTPSSKVPYPVIGYGNN